MDNAVRYKVRTFTVTHSYASEGQVIDCPATAEGLLLQIFGDLDQDVEHFVVLALNVRGRPVGFKVVGQGIQSSCLVHPREVFRAAMFLGASTIIVAHNHPSGDLGASDDDMHLANRLAQAGDLVGIPVLDQLIVTATEARSFVRNLR